MSVLFLTISGFAPFASGQYEYGEIIGTVRDASGGVVSATQVKLRNVETNIEQIAQTNEAGAYSFQALRGGSYTIEADHPGFRAARVANIRLNIGDHLRVDLNLEVGATQETVSVVASSPLLETDTSSRGQVIQGAQIRELPLNQRDYSQLVLLVPGTNSNPSNRLAGGFSINGNRPLQNNYLLDGADNNSNATSYRGDRVDVIRPSVDAVEEFRVLTNSYSAEYGHSAGGVVSVSLKNGTNDFHGTLWEFLRNDALDAHGWTPTLAGVKPELRFNQFGANLGGPIIKDKTFFFVNYEGQQQRNGVTYQNTVPTLDLQQGDFSHIASGLSAPLKVIPAEPSTGKPFAGNVIPVSRWSPVAARILADPNFPKPTPTALIPVPGTYLSTVTNRYSYEKFDVRVDHNLNQTWRLFGRYSFGDIAGFNPAPFQGYVEGSTADSFGTTANRGQNAVAGSTATLSPTTLLETRLGYTRLAAHVFPVNYSSPGVTSLLGIPNMPDDTSINGGWPKFNIAGMAALGRATSTPQYQVPNTYLLNSTLSFVRGKQTIKAGIDEQYLQNADLDISAPIGVFNFIQTTPGTVSGLTGNAWADFLLGHPNSYEQTTAGVIYNRRWIHAFFVQDDYRVLHNLTLNLGLRYEYAPPITEKHNRMANFNLATGQIVYAKSGSMEDRSTLHPNLHDFSPRIGLAWTVHPKIVIRSGYGIFYQFINRQGREGLLGSNPPFVTDLTQTIPGSANPITLDSGPPPNFLSTGTSANLLLRANDPTLRDGYVQQWNFTMQYSVAPNWLVDVAYVGNRGLGLTRFLNPNQTTVPGTSSTLQARRPFPQYSDIEYMDSGGSSSYNALQTRLEKRFGHGFSVLQSFTYSRGIDNIGAWGDSNGTYYPQNAYNFAAEKALSNNTLKLDSVTSFIGQVPVGRGRRFLSQAPKIVDGFLGGWEIDGIWTWRTGFPLTIISNTCGSCQIGGLRTQRGDVVAGVSPNLADPSAQLWFNTAAFRPAATAFGTVGRNTIWGPGMQNWDLTFAKDFHLTEQRYFQFRGDLFNTFNNVNYNPPDGNASNSTFGRITSALPGRQIQFGLKFYF